MSSQSVPEPTPGKQGTANQWGQPTNWLADWGSKLLAIVAAYLVMQLILFVLKRRHTHRTFVRMQVPGPKPHLIHGHLYETRRQAYVKFAHRMHERYGKTVGIYLGGDPYLITKDLDLIQQVFVSKSRLFFNRMFFYLNIDPVPDNLICQRGDRWRYMRRLLTPAFTNSRIRSSHFYLDTEQTVQRLMKQLDQNAITVEPSSSLSLSSSSLSSSSLSSSTNKPAASSSSGGAGGKQETIVEDLYDRMAAVALDVIVKTAFHMDNMISFAGSLTEPVGRHLERTRKPGECTQLRRHSDGSESLPQKDPLLETVKRACRLGFNPLVELIFCFPFLDKPLTFLCNQLYLARIVQVLFDRLDYLVKRRVLPPSSPVKGSPEPDAKAAADEANALPKQQQQRRRIIDSLIEVLKERKITRSEFTGNAFVIVFAGFETTANALTFILWLLAKHQDVQVKLRQELGQRMSKIAASFAAGAKDAAPPEEAATSVKSEHSSELLQGKQQLEAELAELATGCKYLEMVINESLRLYPPVPGLSCRQASTDCTLSNGLRIEPGVNVIPSVFSIHRDKTIWGDAALEFRPERFEVLTMAQLNSAMFMPFGLGPRNCIGKGLAMHEMKIVIGRLVLGYSIESMPGKTPEKLKLCSPINITITPAEKIGLKFVKLKTT